MKTFEELTKIMMEAREAAAVAQKAQLDKLIQKGPAYSIHNADLAGNITGPSQGTMLDLCGFAYCQISLKSLSRRSKAVKQLIENGTLSFWSYDQCLVLRIPGFRQEISVNEAGAQAAADVLKKYEIQAYMTSRVD